MLGAPTVGAPASSAPASGMPLLPWLAVPLAQALATRHAHALLVHGPEGVGQFELALALAKGWLCEAGAAFAGQRPCGVCSSCRLVQARSHPDLLVLLPDALREALGWPQGGAAAEEGVGSDKPAKAKPSKEIKVEAVRLVVAFAQTTAARGRCKAIVVHPAERMNIVAANALLKTLEEPPGQARFVLSCAAPQALLATIRSRCQSVQLELPARDVGLAWLETHGVERADVMLAACGGQPQAALQLLRQGVDANLWQRIPALVADGDAGPLLSLPLTLLVDTLQKLCHDALCVAVGAAPRYFPVDCIAAHAGIAPLTHWAADLRRFAGHAEHPWNAGLAVESLVQQGRTALAAAVQPHATARAASLHSGR